MTRSESTGYTPFAGVGRNRERLPLPVVLETVRAILRSVDLPVSTDIESGYADSADGVRTTKESLGVLVAVEWDDPPGGIVPRMTHGAPSSTAVKKLAR